MGVHSWNAWVPAGRVPRFCIRIPNPAFLSKPFFCTKLCVPALPCSNFASRSCMAFLNGKLFEFLKQVWCDASAWWLSQSPAHNGRTWTASPPGGPARESPVDPCSWSRAGSSDRRGAGSPRGSTCGSAASPPFWTWPHIRRTCAAGRRCACALRGQTGRTCWKTWPRTCHTGGACRPNGPSRAPSCWPGGRNVCDRRRRQTAFSMADFSAPVHCFSDDASVPFWHCCCYFLTTSTLPPHRRRLSRHCHHRRRPPFWCCCCPPCDDGVGGVT